MIEGTPAYTPSSPYSPDRYAPVPKIFLSSLRIDFTISARTAPIP
jgi:hypothetical protein